MKKTATQLRKQTIDIYPADRIAAAAMDNSGTTGTDQDLVQLVWKYFGEEISQTMAEVQEALAPERSGSIQQVSRRKR